VETDPAFEVVEIQDIETHFKAFLAAKDLWEWQQEREKEYRARMESLKESA
jgi:hypothetical protein